MKVTLLDLAIIFLALVAASMAIVQFVNVR